MHDLHSYDVTQRLYEPDGLAAFGAMRISWELRTVHINEKLATIVARYWN